MRYFSWDNNKARANVRKHGISFETAKEAFKDPYAVKRFDRQIGDEERWHTFGMVAGQLLLLVVHTSEDEDDDEYIRIISARKADKGGEAIYFSKNRERGCL